MVVSPDSRWLAMATDAVRLWDLTAQSPPSEPIVLRGHPDRILLKFDPKGRWLVTTAWADATARIWDLDLDSAIPRARRLGGRALTSEERRQYDLE